MFYLILKYTALFALAALLGFLFGRWWARRSFIDVTHDYAAMSRAAAAPWEKVWRRLDAVESALRESRGDLPAGLEALQGNVTQPVTQGFSAVRSMLADLDSHVRAHPVQAAPVDLAPLEQRLAALELALNEIPRSGGTVDLSPLQADIAALSSAFARGGPVDFGPLEQRLGGVERSLESLQVPDLNRWLDVLEKALRSDGRAPAADLEPRLTRIEHAIDQLSKQDAPAAAGQGTAKTAARVSRPARRTVTRGPVEDLWAQNSNDVANLRLLESPRYGSKDDLKQISGIGPKLERELNRQGVYYFWQVADWQANDIQAMDERLEAFRGRIERDGWVTQARRLMDNGNAAARPGD